MNSKDFISRLKDNGTPVITTGGAGVMMQKSPGYTRLYLARLCKSRFLERVENGLFCLPGTDDYTIASRIVPYSYITSYAALSHYRLTTQITTKLQVVSPKYHRPLKLNGHTVTFSKVKRQFIYGYIMLRNGPAFAEPEKIFIDDLYLHRRQYYGEEFKNAVRADRLDISKLKSYAVSSDDKALVSMLGHYLEEQGVSADNLLPYKSRTYLKLARHGSLDRKWRVYV